MTHQDICFSLSTDIENAIERHTQKGESIKMNGVYKRILLQR